MSQRLVWHTVSIAIVMIAQAVMASAPGHGYAAHRTRLNFGDPGTIELYDVQRARTTLGEDPVPGFDPSNPLRGTVVMAVRGPSAEAHSSSMSYTFRETEPLPELHIGFRMYIQHHANMDGLGDLQFLQLLDTGGGELLKAYNGAGGSWFQLGTQLSGYQISTPVPPRVSVRVRLRYRASDPGQSNGILRVWIDGALVLDRNDHDFTQLVQQIVLRCRTAMPLSQHPDDKQVHVSELSWGPNAADALWSDEGLQLGAAHSLSDPAKIDVRVRYGLEVGVHGSVNGGSLSVQYRYRKPPDPWVDAGAPSTVVPVAGEYIDHRTIPGLDPNTTYEFQAIVDDGGSIAVDSNVCTLHLASADAGPATSFDFTFGSCATAGRRGTGATPAMTFLTMRSHTPAFFFHLGDVAYADTPVGAFIPRATTVAGFRQHYRALLVTNMEQHGLYARTSPVFVRDNHDRAGKRFGAGDLAITDPPDVAEHSNTVALEILSGRRLRTLPADTGPGSAGEGSDGTWFTTARCLFIVSDGLYARNGDSGDRTFWGATQLEEIKTLLRENTKPLVFFLNGVLVGDIVNTGQAGVVTQFPEWTAERDQLVQEFRVFNAPTTQLFFLTADRHKIVVWDWHCAQNIRPEWSVSPLAQNALDLAGSFVENPHYTGWGPYEVDQQATFLYGHVQVDEENLQVTITARDGEDGAIVHQEVYSPPTGPAPCPTDLNGNGEMDFADILAVIGAWGPCLGCPEDLDESGDVGFADILVILGAWGPCCAFP